MIYNIILYLRRVKIDFKEFLYKSNVVLLVGYRTKISLYQGIAVFEREVLETGTFFLHPIPICTKDW